MSLPLKGFTETYNSSLVLPGTADVNVNMNLLETNRPGPLLKNKFSRGLRAYCAGFLFISALGRAYAAGPGTGAADFLKIPVGARETSLGGAYTAAAENANSVYYNPAGLGLLQNPEISLTQNKFVEGISQQWLSAAYPYRSGGFGLGVNYLSIPPFASYDSSDHRTGSVSAYSMAMYLAYGGALPLDYKFIRSLSYGASLKYISEKLDTEKGDGYGLDLGLLAASAIDNLRFGFGIENAVSSKIKFIEHGARPPLKLKTGAVYKVRFSDALTTQVSMDYYFWTDRPGYAAVGIENLINDAFAVRVGYSSFGDISNGLNFGLGFDPSRYIGRSLCVDYSFGATYDFGDIHKLSVIYKFGPPPREGSAQRAVRQAGGPYDDTFTAYYIETLSNGSLAQKRAILARLHQWGGEELFNLLLAMLKDKDPDLVMDVISALSGFNNRRVIAPFVALLDSKNTDIRLALISKLARFRDDSVLNALEGRLSDESPTVRSRTAGVLLKWEDVRAVKSLRAAFRKEKVKAVRDVFKNALKKLDPEFKDGEP